MNAALVDERRKVASLLFCDVVGSTELGESSDPEVVRLAMSHYFEICRTAIERHGGRVEKYIGDAVMAGFGLPQGHEDDAARAVSAATDIWRGVEDSADHFGRLLGRPLQVRIGVATGEVVAGGVGARMTMVTGDAVNTAARLESAGSPGTLLVDRTTARLTGSAYSWRAAEPLSVKGKSQPVEVFELELQCARPRVPDRRAGSLTVGRRREKELLRGKLRRIELEGVQVVTLVGEAGIGKSSLIDAALGDVPRDSVLRAACPAHGEALTYYPLRDLLVSAGAELDTMDGLAGHLTDVLGSEEAVGMPQVLGSALGMVDVVSTPGDIEYAVRRWLDALAASRGSLVVVVEDVHWAEPAFRELLLALASGLTGRVLLVYSARGDVLEDHPDWPAVETLQGLAPKDVASIMEAVLGAEPDAKVRDFVISRSNGNPFFVQQLTEHLREHSVGSTPRSDGEPATLTGDGFEFAGVPTSLATLLGARLDRSPAHQRILLEAAAVEGDTFHRGAVSRLAQENGLVDSGLAELEQEQLIAPDAPVFPMESAYRFRHLLIRDAAYRGLPKRHRAVLHERYADWLLERAGPRLAEFEELLAHHLEQTLRYRRESGGDADPLLEAQVGTAKYRAGTRAASRGDARAAEALLGRAVELLDDRAREAPLAWLALAQLQWDGGRLDEAAESLERARDLADVAREPMLRAQCVLRSASLALMRSPSTDVTRAEAVLAKVREYVLAGDDAVARAFLHVLESDIALHRNDMRTAIDTMALALAEAHRSGDDVLIARMLELSIGSWTSSISEIRRQCRHVHAWAAPRGLRRLEGEALLLEAAIEAVSGHFKESRKLYRLARTTLDDVGATLIRYLVGCEGPMLEAAGDSEGAAREFAESVAGLRASGERSVLPTMTARYARALCRAGRLTEAEDCIEQSRAEGHADDVVNEIEWRTALAMIRLRQRRRSEAARLAVEARRLCELDNGFATLQSVELIETLLHVGRADVAVPLAREALEVLTRLEYTVAAENVTRLLAQIDKPIGETREGRRRSAGGTP